MAELYRNLDEQLRTYDISEKPDIAALVNLMLKFPDTPVQMPKNKFSKSDLARARLALAQHDLAAEQKQQRKKAVRHLMLE